MPFYFDPASTCDVCMDPYSVPGESLDISKTPHVIACGHVFCQNCLLNVRVADGNEYPACPQCRKFFRRDKIKRLHTDRAEDTTTQKDLLNAKRRIETVADKISRHEQDRNVQEFRTAAINVGEVVQVRCDDPDKYLLRLFDSLASVMERYDIRVGELSEIEHRLKRRIRECEEDKKRRAAIEDTYMDKIETLERELARFTIPNTAPPNPLPAPPKYLAPPPPLPMTTRPAPSTPGATFYLGAPNDKLVIPPPVQVAPTISREERQKEIKLEAELRRQVDADELPQRGDVIEQGNALGLAGEGGSAEVRSVQMTPVTRIPWPSQRQQEQQQQPAATRRREDDRRARRQSASAVPMMGGALPTQSNSFYEPSPVPSQNQQQLQPSQATQTSASVRRLTPLYRRETISGTAARTPPAPAPDATPAQPPSSSLYPYAAPFHPSSLSSPMYSTPMYAPPPPLAHSYSAREGDRARASLPPLPRFVYASAAPAAVPLPVMSTHSHSGSGRSSSTSSRHNSTLFQ